MLSLLLAVPTLTLGACQPSIRMARAGTWPYAPTSMRISPLTHVAPPRVNAPRAGFSPQAGVVGVIEVFIELTDVDGFDTRGIGQLAISVSASGDASLPPLNWAIDLDDLQVNRTYFDWVTRTYRLPLVLEWPVPPRSRVVAIEARLTLAGVGELRSSTEVRWPNEETPPAAP